MSVAAGKAVDVERLDAYLYAPIVKIDEEQRMVYGYASTPSLDLDNQIADPEWLKQALPEWFDNWGNMRLMHHPIAVGKAKEMEFDDKGPWLGAKVVASEAWELVKEGVLNGFSIGIKKPVYSPDPNAPRGRITGGKIIEVSLVDRPANDDCRFALVKSVGPGEWRDEQTGIVLKKEGTLVGELSFEEIRDKINGMVGNHNWVMETYPDHVVICCYCEGLDDKYYKIPYTMDAENNITLGNREEVERVYQPVQKAAAMKAAGKDDPEPPEPEKCSKCGETMKPGEEHKCSKEADSDGEEGADGKAATPAGAAVIPEAGKAGKKMSADRLAKFQEIKAQIDTLLGELAEPPAVDEGRDEAGKAATDGVPISGKLDFYSLAVIKEVRAQLQALAAQVDAAINGVDPGSPGGAGSVPATKHSPNPGDPTFISAADLPKLVAAEFAKILSIPENSLEKAATPDTTHSLFADAVKAAVADAVKAAVDPAIGGFSERLEKVEQMAAPAKGVLMEVEKTFAGNPATVVSDIKKAVDTLSETAQDNSEQAQLKRAQAIYSLSNLARKGA